MIEINKARQCGVTSGDEPRDRARGDQMITTMGPLAQFASGFLFKFNKMFSTHENS